MEIIILLILVLINGFFSLSEISLVSSRKNRLEVLASKGSKGAKTALRLQKKSENFLSSIQIGITLIGIITGVYGGMSLSEEIKPVFLHSSFTRPYAAELALFLTVGLITYISIVIGELVPKTIAMSNPEAIARRVARPIAFFTFLFYPVVRLLSVSTNFINRLLGISKSNDSLSESELRQLLKTASVEGVIERNQNLIHEKVFSFSDKKARHVMTHRTDIEWIDVNDSIDDIKTRVLQMNHSRIVCADGDLDHFTGFVRQKDLFKAFAGNQKFDLPEIVIDPILVPESAVATSVLELLRKGNGKICFVINEYGGFEGIITLHDVLEHIIGMVSEEWENSNPQVLIREDKSILIDGDAPVELLTELIPGFEVDFEEIDYSTVAGLIFSRINRFPRTGDKIPFGRFSMEIVDMDGARIDKVLIMINDQE